MKYNMNRREQILSFLMTNRDGSFTAEQVAALPVRILGVVEEMRRSKHRR